MTRPDRAPDPVEGETMRMRPAVSRLLLRRPTGEDGAGSVEYIGAILVVGALILSLVMGSTPVGALIAEKLCDAFGTSCAAGDRDADGDRVPDQACTLGEDSENINANVTIAFIDLGADGTMTIEKMSDGTYKVTVGGEAGAAAVASAGEIKGGLQIGDYGGALALTADARAGIFAGAGVEYEFSSKKDAEDFTEYVHRTIAKSGAKSVGSAINPAVGVGVDVIGWAIDKVTGYSYDPPLPDYSYYEAGISGAGNAQADAILAGGSASANLTTALGARINHETKDVTIYNKVNLDAEAAAKLGLSASDGNWGQGAEGSASIEIVVATTVDSSGTLKDVSFDGAATAEGAAALTGLAGFPLQGSGGKGVSLSAQFDVTDSNRTAVTSALVGIGVLAATTGQPFSAPQQAIPAIMLEARRSGDITAQTLDVSGQNLVNAALGLKAPLVGGLEFGLGASTSTQESTGAYYLGANGWKDWAACAA